MKYIMFKEILFEVPKDVVFFVEEDKEEFFLFMLSRSEKFIIFEKFKTKISSYKRLNEILDLLNKKSS